MHGASRSGSNSQGGAATLASTGSEPSILGLAALLFLMLGSLMIARPRQQD
ncbi:hypothetical protein [Microbacterium arabinogalactanolyticum]|uniref:hypothetical protein n=1 Tax=Microbacterium arabinogalactanolyticum TaxID=69365 RepID=UPI002557085D|nr:hypothetical protein [Microbacterium arabinogalactanolyticum]